MTALLVSYIATDVAIHTGCWPRTTGPAYDMVRRVAVQLLHGLRH